jgi:hypothetical protein
MRTSPLIPAAACLTIQMYSPAGAITADLAKKCQALAVQAHPPRPAGSSPYAQAERDFFRQCVSRNGDMRDGLAPNPQPIRQTGRGSAGQAR